MPPSSYHLICFLFINSSRLRIRLPDPSEMPKASIPRMDYANRADAPVRLSDELFICIYIYVCMDGWMHVCMYVCMYVCIYIYEADKDLHSNNQI